jgi:2-polyprenyl-6-methoxyphenol hydroxylase-like FAD-dependent oxidoreductase
MKVLVIGGGIGGLTLALELHTAGIPVQVFESVETLSPLGVGINVLPHAMRNLTRLGVADALCDVAIETRELVYYNHLGQKVGGEPRGRYAGYDVPQLSIHRGELQMVLLHEVQRRLGQDAVLTGHHLADFHETNDGKVVARFVNRETKQRVGEAVGDLLVAADGIHSTVRAHFYPDEGAPKWNGEIFWRAVTVGAPFLTGASMSIAGDSKRRFMAYPISRKLADEGKTLINWVACLRVDPAKGYRRENWNRSGSVDDFIGYFENWHFDWLDVPAVIKGAEVVLEYPCVDRDPIDRWTFGRVTLLGDAAHAMYPMGSNGASQSILDAECLALALKNHAGVTEALAAYEAQRRPVTSEIVMRNRAEGPSVVLSIAEQRAPNGFPNGESVISPSEYEEISSSYKKLAGFDRATVNNPRESAS